VPGEAAWPVNLIHGDPPDALGGGSGGAMRRTVVASLRDTSSWYPLECATVPEIHCPIWDFLAYLSFTG
jgi:hypothetical protein